MQLYFIFPTTFKLRYGVYLGAVVAAEDEAAARKIHPNGLMKADWWVCIADDPYSNWTWLENISVRHIGTTSLPAGVVLLSFNPA